MDILTKSADNPGLGEVPREGGAHYLIIISGVLLMVALSISITVRSDPGPAYELS